MSHLKRFTYFMIISGTALISLWAWFLVSPKTYSGTETITLSGVAYNPQTRWGNLRPDNFKGSDVDHDLRNIAKLTDTIRTYSSGKFFDQLPTLAQQNKLDIIAGAWVGVNPTHDSAELSSLLSLSKIHTNIKALIIGNEVLLRKDISPAHLQRYLSEANTATKLPVSTAEPWHVWMSNPKLVENSDFLAVHILPYWEGISVQDAVPYIDARLSELKNTYPNKPILLAEVGWPSAGLKRGKAVASQTNQALFVREFLDYASDNALEYILLEAYDQPWKTAKEGSVGAYWGLFTAERRAKWQFGNFIVAKSNWPLWAFVSAILGSFLQIVLLCTWPTFPPLKLVPVGICFQLLTAAAIFPFLMAFDQYLNLVALIIWLFLSFAQLPLWLLLMSDLVELSNVAWKKQIRLLQPTQSPKVNKHSPYVSIHLPCSNEPPEIVIESLHSLAQLNYPYYEVIVISNNCIDKKCWQPVAETCYQLGEKFRFFHIDHYPGYKAGALNLARKYCSVLTEIIAVTDSDYVVEENWLCSLVPVFENENIGIVQAPQDHRSDLTNTFQKGCFWEYIGFFQIGMVQRNEANAIIQHGTMTLVRLKALDEVDGWSEWCLTEDAELGLKLFQKGWEAQYTQKSFGKGLLPPHFKAYRTQRFRWVYGGVQILRHHFLCLTGLRKSSLTWSQRYHYMTGWLPWLSDFGGLIFNIGALCWTAAMSLYPERFPPPSSVFLLPVLGFLILRQARNNVLYKLRVKCSHLDWWRASIAGLALSNCIARAVFFGTLRWRTMPFVRTPKTGKYQSTWRLLREISVELILLFLTLTLSVVFCLRTGINDRLEMLWILVLIMQSLPYMCTLQMGLGAGNHHGTKKLTMSEKQGRQTGTNSSVWKRNIRVPKS